MTSKPQFTANNMDAWLPLLTSIKASIQPVPPLTDEEIILILTNRPKLLNLLCDAFPEQKNLISRKAQEHIIED